MIDIVGAAITGPTAALTLALRGHDVTVHEARGKDDLFSAGILGMTHGNVSALESLGVDFTRYELPHRFTDVSMMVHGDSPFRYVTWTGLHTAITDAASDAGVRFTWNHRVNVDALRQTGTTVIEATGVAGAARKHLPHEYTGITIYRGLSTRYIGEDFTVWHADMLHMDPEYITAGDTPDGAVWAYFTHRREPVPQTVQLKTPPRSTAQLPAEFRRIVHATPTVLRSPLSSWRVPASMMDESRTYLTLGDVNGPIHPITTSGANLAVIEGMAAGDLVTASDAEVRRMQRGMLRRRAYDLQLGRMLSGPEIGGKVEDSRFGTHHRALFPGDQA